MNLSSLAWLTWRQHRWSILAVAAIALLAAYALLSTETQKAATDSMPISGFYGLIVQLGFGCVIGMFWGAPLIARELEERTYFVAWGQGVTPVKWLRGKVVVLGVLAGVLGATVGLGDGYVGVHTSWPTFEAHPLLQAGYAVLGLALGVLIGLLTRHVVTAMAATLVFFTLVRVLLAVLARDRYLPPQRVMARWESTPVVPAGGLEIGSGFVGPDMRSVPTPDRCVEAINVNSCMRSTKTAIGTYVDFQPVERIGLFRFFEFGVCALLAAALFAVTFRMLRRGGGWKPSRSHRRISTAPDPAPGPAAASEPRSVSAPSVQSTPETAAAQTDG